MLSLLSCLFPPIIIILMYFIVFFWSRDLWVSRVQSQNFKLFFSRPLWRKVFSSSTVAVALLFLNEYRLSIPLVKRWMGCSMSIKKGKELEVLWLPSCFGFTYITVIISAFTLVSQSTIFRSWKLMDKVFLHEGFCSLTKFNFWGWRTFNWPQYFKVEFAVNPTSKYQMCNYDNCKKLTLPRLLGVAIRTPDHCHCWTLVIATRMKVGSGPPIAGSSVQQRAFEDVTERVFVPQPPG